jgi:hypothetical protein
MEYEVARLMKKMYALDYVIGNKKVIQKGKRSKP